MRRAAQLWVLAAALVISGCGGHHQTPTSPEPPQPPAPPAPPPPPPPTLGVTTIVAFGDSLTEGVNGDTNQLSPNPYPQRLATLLQARYTAQTIDVTNAGRSGERAARASSRLNSVLNEKKPQLLLLLEGANDLGDAGIQGATNAVEDLVRQATYRGVIVMVATYPPENPKGPRGGNAALVPPFNASLRTMAMKKGAMLVDIYSQFDVSLVGADGLHPSDAGYQRMAEIFRDAIQTAFEQPPPSTALGR